MTQLLLQPEPEMSAVQNLKLRHLPAVFLYLAGVSAVFALLMGFALALEIVAVVVAVLFISVVLLVVVPILLIAARMNKA